MRRAPLVIVCLAACASDPPDLPNAPGGPTGPAPVGMHPDPVDLGIAGAFDAALAARVRPETVLPARPVTRLGRCAVEVAPRPAASRAIVLAELVARNGPGWDARAMFDAYHDGELNYLDAPADTSDAPRTPPDKDEALASVVSFVVTNYELFALTRDDLAVARVRIGGELSPDRFEARDVELRGPERAGRPPLWHGEVELGWHGEVWRMFVGTFDLLPKVELCDTPLLSASDPRVVASVLGYHLSYGDMSGVHPVGVVVARDLGAITLVDRRDTGSAPGYTLIRRLYQVVVEHSSFKWSFYVDPDTGELVKVEDEFIVN